MPSYVTDRWRRHGAPAPYALADAFAIGVGSLLAAALAPAGTSPAGRLLAVLASAGALLAGLRLTSANDRSRRRIAPLPSDDLGAVLGGLALGAVSLTAARALAPAALAPVLAAPAPLEIAVLVAGLLPIARAGAAAGARHRGHRTRVLVVGTGHVAAEVTARLARTGRVDVVGHVDDEPAPGADSERVLGRLSGLSQLCDELAVERVVVAFSRSHPGHVAAMLRDLPEHIEVAIVPRYFELTGWHAVLDDVSGLTLLSLGDRRPGRGARAVKRALDCAVAAGLLTLGAPLLAAAALAVHLESPGPVLFRQERLGRARKSFRIMKLRTMVPLDADADRTIHRPAVPGAHEWDPRITPIARLVRRLGIDELPQLVNVLRGEMSLVGPRPLVAEECTGLADWADRRFDVRPGLTGMWQVCGQHDLSFDELRRLDYQYATSWSIATDLRILARTPGRLLHGAGGLAVSAPTATGAAPAGASAAVMAVPGVELLADRRTQPALLAPPASQLRVPGDRGDGGKPVVARRELG